MTRARFWVTGHRGEQQAAKASPWDEDRMAHARRRRCAGAVRVRLTRPGSLSLVRGA